MEDQLLSPLMLSNHHPPCPTVLQDPSLSPIPRYRYGLVLQQVSVQPQLGSTRLRVLVLGLLTPILLHLMRSSMQSSPRCHPPLLPSSMGAHQIALLYLRSHLRLLGLFTLQPRHLSSHLHRHLRSFPRNLRSHPSFPGRKRKRGRNPLCQPLSQT